MADLLEVDYLVVGAGAMGMAFVDTLLTESDNTVAIVDRNARPGGTVHRQLQTPSTCWLTVGNRPLVRVVSFCESTSTVGILRSQLNTTGIGRN